jgi:N12 class adenine-specific DNA methylase
MTEEDKAKERLEKIKASKRKWWHSEKGRAAALRRKLKQTKNDPSSQSA